LGIIEILIVLIVALIVIPPERLPEVMQAVGKILRELRLASNTILRELSAAVEEPGNTEQLPNNPIVAQWSSRRDTASTTDQTAGQTNRPS